MHKKEFAKDFLSLLKLMTKCFYCLFILNIIFSMLLQATRRYLVFYEMYQRFASYIKSLVVSNEYFIVKVSLKTFKALFKFFEVKLFAASSLNSLVYLFCLQVEAVTFEKSTLHLTLFPFTHWYSLLCKAKSSGQAYKGSLLFVNLSLFHSSFSVILSVCFSFHFVFSYFILISLPLILTLCVPFLRSWLVCLSLCISLQVFFLSHS